jgi:hypothetical protein
MRRYAIKEKNMDPELYMKNSTPKPRDSNLLGISYILEIFGKIQFQTSSVGKKSKVAI